MIGQLENLVPKTLNMSSLIGYTEPMRTVTRTIWMSGVMNSTRNRPIEPRERTTALGELKRPSSRSGGGALPLRAVLRAFGLWPPPTPQPADFPSSKPTALRRAHPLRFTRAGRRDELTPT